MKVGETESLVVARRDAVQGNSFLLRYLIDWKKVVIRDYGSRPLRSLLALLRDRIVARRKFTASRYGAGQEIFNQFLIAHVRLYTCRLPRAGFRGLRSGRGTRCG